MNFGNFIKIHTPIGFFIQCDYEKHLVSKKKIISPCQQIFIKNDKNSKKKDSYKVVFLLKS